MSFLCAPGAPAASCGSGACNSQFRRLSVRAQASSSNWRNGPYEEGLLKQPKYTGDEPLSKFVSALISFEPLFGLMKLGAREFWINGAENKGIPWREMSEEILASEEIKGEKELLENKTLVYPEYYLQQFHAYKDGNLSWLAASEVEAATMSMIKRTLPAAESIDEAVRVLRGNWLRAIQEHHAKHSKLTISQVLDVGCSVGASTIEFAERFPDAQVTGLDLSPYFLAVAQHREKQRVLRKKLRRKQIRWIHANGEQTGLPDASFDIVSLAYVVHECPQRAIRGLMREAYRILKPGGTFAITDNSPKSKILQSLPAPVFTLMKSTEPWMDEYYSFDLEQEAQDAGFENVVCKLTNPRHRTLTATVPEV